MLSEAGEFEAPPRPAGRLTWQMVRDTVLDRLASNPAVRKIRADVERKVKAGS